MSVSNGSQEEDDDDNDDEEGDGDGDEILEEFIPEKE